MIRILVACLAVCGLGAIQGCGSDNSEEISKLSKPEPSNNPDVPPVDAKDMSMNDNPKALRGKQPGGGL